MSDVKEFLRGDYRMPSSRRAASKRRVSRSRKQRPVSKRLSRRKQYGGGEDVNEVREQLFKLKEDLMKIVERVDGTLDMVPTAEAPAVPSESDVIVIQEPSALYEQLQAAFQNPMTPELLQQFLHYNTKVRDNIEALKERGVDLSKLNKRNVQKENDAKYDELMMQLSRTSNVPLNDGSKTNTISEDIASCAKEVDDVSCYYLRQAMTAAQTGEIIDRSLLNKLTNLIWARVVTDALVTDPQLADTMASL